MIWNQPQISVHIAPMFDFLNQWILLGLDIGICVKGYLQEHDSMTVALPKSTLALVTAGAGNLEFTAQLTNRCLTEGRLSC